jgi:hypothetical protein
MVWAVVGCDNWLLDQIQGGRLQIGWGWGCYHENDVYVIFEKAGIRLLAG